MRIGRFALPSLTTPVKIGAILALAFALSAGGGLSGLFGGGTAVSPGGTDGKGGNEGVATPTPDQGAIGDRVDLVRTGSFALEVADLEASLARLSDVAKAQGGYLSASYRSGDAATPYVEVTFRIPAATFDAYVAAIRAEGSVLNEQVSTYEVTGQLIDLEARLANLRASESAYLALMDKATSVADILAVQAELTRVRGDIESYEAQRAQLADLVAMTSVTVRLAETASPLVGGFDLGREFNAALANLVSIARGAIVAGLNLFVVALPIALVGALLGGLIGRAAPSFGRLLVRLVGIGSSPATARRRPRR